MKRGLLGLILMMLFSVACDDSNDDSKKSSDTRIKDIQNAAGNGQWRIAYFSDSGEEETDNFQGYIFEFDANNIVTATNGSSNYPGTWSVTDDDNSDDDNDDFDDIDFNITFTNPDDFEELSEDWEIVSLTGTKIELRHVSGGNGGNDLLTFNKI